MFLVDPESAPGARSRRKSSSARRRAADDRDRALQPRGQPHAASCSAGAACAGWSGSSKRSYGSRARARACRRGRAARGHPADAAMSDLRLDNITPNPRYYELNRALSELARRRVLRPHQGPRRAAHDARQRDAGVVQHELPDPPASRPARSSRRSTTWRRRSRRPCSPRPSTRRCCFGHRLWQETRIALFQHSTDARSRHAAGAQPAAARRLRRGLAGGLRPRTLPRADRALPRHHTTESRTRTRWPCWRAAACRVSRALRLHNGTVWPWNRACYGVADGRAHLRIENRALPAGPTVLDEMANAAFFVGADVGAARGVRRDRRADDIRRRQGELLRRRALRPARRSSPGCGGQSYSAVGAHPRTPAAARARGA